MVAHAYVSIDLQYMRAHPFTAEDVLLAQRFYRVKADLESIPNEIEADRFIVTAKQFIDRVKLVTEPIYNQTVAADPQVGLRRQNMSTASTERTKKLTTSVLHVVPRISNTGFRDVSRAQVAMYRVANPLAAGSGIETKSPRLSVALPASSERFLRYDAEVAGDPEEDVTSSQANLLDEKKLETSDRKPTFNLGELGNPNNPPLDFTTDFGNPHAVVFTIDLPDRTVRESNRRNNVGGFFYYILDTTVADPASLTIPSTPVSVPQPISSPPPGMLDPDAQCEDPPSFDVRATYSLGQLHLTIKNVSSGVLKDIGYCSSVAGVCAPVTASLSPGQETTIDIAVPPPDEPTILELNTTVYAKDTDGNSVQLVATRQVSSSAAPIKVLLFDASPLQSLAHPFSRYAISHKHGSTDSRPIVGAVTDGGESSVRISIDGLKPGTPTDLSIADADDYHVLDGVGWLSPTAATPGTTGARSLRLSVIADASGHAQAFYTPPDYFLRPSRQNQDFDLVHRQVALTVQQSGVGSSVIDISLRRPPVFLVHGLFGSIGVWDDFRPLLPESSYPAIARIPPLNMTDAEYFKSRAGWVGRFGGRFDLFNVGSEHATQHLDEEAQIVQQHIAISLVSYLPGYAISTIDLVAHSMGGLLSRKMIGEQALVRDAVRKLIIINSPLRGSPLADKVAETRDLVTNLLATTPQDPWNPKTTAPIANIVQNNLCWNAFQRIGKYTRFNIFNGALDDLRTQPINPEIDRLIDYVRRGLTVPTHHIVTTTTGADLGYSLEVGGLWHSLGMFCNWTPDTSTVSATQNAKFVVEAVKDIAQFLATGGAGAAEEIAGFFEAAKTAFNGYKISSDSPTPIFGNAPNDRVVPVASQLEGLLAGDNSVTEVFGFTDHQDIKSTNAPPASCVEVDASGITQFHTPTIVPDLDFDGQPDAVCHVIKLLELDPSRPEFKR